jgi:WD40 repeat protein
LEETPPKEPLQVEEQWKDNIERFPLVMFELPDAVGGSLQIHPKDNTAGLAVLAGGDLVVFRAPSNVWSKLVGQTCDEPTVKVVTVWKGDNVTSASFSHVGDRIFLATKSGDLIGIDVGHIMYCLTTSSTTLPVPDVVFRVSVGSMAWHLLVSRNGKYLLLNCADGCLRLYNTQDCIEKAPNLKPKTFQDLVSKEPFVCCDFSGDGEYIVGGCNGVRDDKYELYLWNTATGALMDRLTGAPVSLYSVAWHPTRSFLAVATSDGLVDVWGPRMDWTAFAPDFQALPMNVEYVEQEDEFDIAVEDDEKGSSDGNVVENVVDVVMVDAVPVFASDSESESEVFTFETKMNNLMFGRGKNHAKADGNLGKED